MGRRRLRLSQASPFKTQGIIGGADEDQGEGGKTSSSHEGIGESPYY